LHLVLNIVVVLYFILNIVVVLCFILNIVVVLCFIRIPIVVVLCFIRIPIVVFCDSSHKKIVGIEKEKNPPVFQPGAELGKINYKLD
jgi:hypothetical protein